MSILVIDTVKYPPPPPEGPAERKGRLAALFVMPFLIVTMMYATYVATMHEPTLSGMPVAVVGQGQAAEAFAEGLESDALDVTLVDGAAEAEKLMDSQEIAGALVLPAAKGEPAEVLTQMAGGASRATTVKTALGAAATEAGFAVETTDLRPLPADDGTGTMVLFAAIGMMLAGYVPLSGMLMGTPNLLRLRRFVPLAIGWGAFTSSLIWLVLGPLVGAVDGRYPLFLGVGTLAVTAVAMMMVLVTKVMGPFSVLVGMLLLMVLGVPAANLGMAIDSMPAFFGWLHGVLPLPAAGEALRSAIYFDGEGFWGHIWVLVAWLVVSLALAALKERKSGDVIPAGPVYTAPDAPLSALAGGPVASYRTRLVAVALFPLSIMLTVVTLMGFSMHKAEINDMPVAIVGASAQTGELVAGLEEQMGSYVELSELTDIEDAREAVLDEEIAAAFVMPSAENPQATLLTASGLSLSQQSAAVAMFTPVAASMEMELVTEDLAPLTANDTGGSNSMYIGMGWVMAGFIFMAVLRGGAPDLTRTRQLLPMVAGWSLGMAVWFWLLYDVIIGAVNGHALELIGYGAFTIFCVAWASGVLTRMFGMMTLVPVMIVMLLGGMPASGGGLSLYMVPEFFQTLHHVLPLPQAIDIARQMVYVDGAGVGTNLLTLLAWGVVGLLLHFFVVDPYVNRAKARPHAPMGPRHVPQRGESAEANDSDDNDEADESDGVREPSLV